MQVQTYNNSSLRHMVNLVRPYKSTNKIQQLYKPIYNIFKNSDEDFTDIKSVNNSFVSCQGQLPQLSTSKLYDFVGPLQLRHKILNSSTSTKLQQTKNNTSYIKQSKQQQQTKNLNQTISTINKGKIIEKLEKDEQNTYLKHNKILNRYHDYKQQWSKQSNNIQRRSKSNYQKKSYSMNLKKQPTLLERAVKKIYVQQNRDKLDIINDNVTRYWQMSLRDNNKTLKLYMKGTRYNGVQLEELLQTTNGKKEVQRSIPTLNHRRKIHNLQKHQQPLILSGRRSQIGQYSLNTTKLSSHIQQQVYKISYDGRKHYLGTQGL